MIGLFNRFLNTWAARAFFIVLLIALVGWGAGDMLRNLGGAHGVAVVDGTDISDQAFDAAYRRDLAKLTHAAQAGGEPTLEMRQALGRQTLDRLILQAALTDAVHDQRLAVPEATIRQATFDIPAFKNKEGEFDRQRFDALLQANNLNEPRFVAMMRDDLGQQQLIEAVRAGANPSGTLTNTVFALQAETRVADMVQLPFAAAPDPPSPDLATLRRAYDNDPQSYTSPEYRKIKAVVLSPETVARGVTISDDDLRAAYQQRQSDFVKPERRSLSVIIAPAEPAARLLAQRWETGTPWGALQRTANAEGGSALQLPDTTRDQIPSPELADAAFGAAAGQIVGPVHSAMGWQVLKVDKIMPGSAGSFADAMPALRDQLARSKGADLMYERVGKVQDALASGSKLDELPGDLGLAALQGTLDRHGLTQDGEPAPLPGTEQLHSAIIAAVFAVHPNDPPQLTEVQGGSPGSAAYYAVQLESVTPPGLKPFDTVRDQVRDDWIRATRRHAQEQAAAKLLSAVKAGQDLRGVAKAMGLPMTTTAPIPRQGLAGVPAGLPRVLFDLKPHEGTMIETADGFTVAQLMQIRPANRNSDPPAYRQLHDELDVAVGNDLEETYMRAIRRRAAPRVDQRKFDQLITPSGS